MTIKILISHNRYQQRGGEDSVVKDEIKLLRDHGHEVLFYERDNAELNQLNKLHVALDTIWSTKTTQEISNIIKHFQPDVIHSHNTFPLISPSLYWASSKFKIPIVQTLHNFRLFCLQAMLLKDGKICEDCIGKLPWRGIYRKCYRNSISQSTVLAALIYTHRLLGTYKQKVSRYIALNEFCKDVFIKGGLPPERISIKPNFVDLAASQSPHTGKPLFVGRLSTEKGIHTLVEAQSDSDKLELDIVGSGPLEDSLYNKRGIHLFGQLDSYETYKKMREASYLIMPSIWYENFPRTLVESFACGLPIIASRLGAMAELIDDGYTGLLFNASSSCDLKEKMLWASDHPHDMAVMGNNARKVYEEQFTSDINYQQLINIYNEVIHNTANSIEN